MIKIRQRKSWIALLFLVLLFAACKGETPTAPPAGGGSGGSQPPTGANLTLSVSNATPIIDSTVVVTATVTQNGVPVPNGTAVEFTTSGGTFTDVTPGVTSIIRTTTNGIAAVHLTSATAGVVHVTATVNNVTRTVDVDFRTTPACVPPDPRCPVLKTPTITAVTPSVGKPQGGDIITITGTNFIAPVRVLFDTGTGTPVEAVIVSSTENEIKVITPSVNLGAGQQLKASIIVVTKLGSGAEERVSAADAFTFRNTALTPIIYSLSPTSGPINGGTRVTIFGEGFQAPVQVFFGSAEAHVISTDFSQILVDAPEARLTVPDGSSCGSTGCTGPTTVTVTNINSNTRGTSPQSFRYVAKMQIAAISPLAGSSVGGTDVTIDGFGFDSPLQVLVAGIEAQVIRVSGTQLLVRTGPAPSPCAGAAGPITVKNIENLDSATSATSFAYIAVTPQITSATNPVTAGNAITAIVLNPGVGQLGTANIRFELGKGPAQPGDGVFTIIPSPSTITSGTGSQTFTIPTPTTGFKFPTQSCTTGGGAPGTTLGPVDVPLTFRNLTTNCPDTISVTVQPLNPVCVQAPPQAQLTAPATGCAIVATPVSTTGSTSITIKNNASAGSQNLLVTGAVSPGAFSINPNTQVSIAPGASTSFNVSFTAPATPGSTSGTATFTTNDPVNPTITVCLTGNATP